MSPRRPPKPTVAALVSATPSDATDRHVEFAALHFTSEQLQTIFALATPVPAWARDTYLRGIAWRLQHREIGDGSVHKAALESQRDALNTAHNAAVPGAPRYGSRIRAQRDLPEPAA
jgi:hypothetical protein